MKKIGYVTRLDIDGELRIREQDAPNSPIVFEGKFKAACKDCLKFAFRMVEPVEVTIEDGVVVRCHNVPTPE